MASTDATAGQTPAASPSPDATAGQTPAASTNGDPIIVNPTAAAATPAPSVYYRPLVTGFMIDTPDDDKDPNQSTLTGDAWPLYSKPNSPGFVTSHGDLVSQTTGPMTINESFAANASKPDSYGNVFKPIPTDDAVNRGSYGYYDGYYHGYYHSGGIIIMPGSSGYRTGGGMSFQGGSFGG